MDNEKIARELLKMARQLTAASLAKRVAMEMARAFDGQYSKNVMSPYGGYDVFFNGAKGGPAVHISIDDEDVEHMGGSMTGDEERLVKGIARRFGLRYED